MLPVALARSLQNHQGNPQMAKSVCKPDKGKESQADGERQRGNVEGKGGSLGKGAVHLLVCRDRRLPDTARLRAPQQQLSASQSQLLQHFLQKVQHLSQVAVLLQLCLSAAAAAVALSASSLHPAAVVALLLRPATASISLL